jgi:hypothetical protein
MTFDDVTGATGYSLSFEFSSGRFTVTAETGWLDPQQTGHALTFPDLSGVPNFKTSYAPALGSSQVYTTASALTFSSDATSSRRTTSSVSQMLPIPQ